VVYSTKTDINQSDIPTRQHFNCVQLPWRSSTLLDIHPSRRQHNNSVLVLAAHRRANGSLNGKLWRRLRTFNASQGNWFKITQRGLISGTIQEGMWGQIILGGENWVGTPELWTETIPAALEPGNHLVRHEIIALHIANKPQWYPQCAHLRFTGNGTQSPEKAYLAKVPGVYSMDRELFFLC
jgi:hypothetical protein